MAYFDGIELKEGGWFILSPDCGDYTKELGLYRKDIETKNKALKQIKRFTRLLALRDQKCPNSRGTDFVYRNSYHVYYDDEEGKYIPFKSYTFILGAIYFKTEEDAQKICDILNSGKFDLKGE